MKQLFRRKNIFDNPLSEWEAYTKDHKSFNFPERIIIELTNRCNLTCIMCPRNNVKMELGDMPMSMFKNIIDEVACFLPVCVVPFFRGESFLHPQFLEMVSYAKIKNLKPIQIATNACFLTYDMTKKFLDLGVDFISFSIDVNYANIYEKIRKNSDFEKVFSNVLAFIKEKEIGNYMLPQIQISAVKTKENKTFIKEFVDFWRDKVDRVRIYCAHSLDGRLGYIMEKESEHKNRKPCLKVLTEIAICWNGDVALCCYDWQRDGFIGNIKHNSIEEIWKNKAYEAIRRKHIENNINDFYPCNSCSYWEAYYVENYCVGELHEKA